MARYVPLPHELSARSFDVREASELGVRPTRLRSADLVAPFHGVRMHTAAAPTLPSLCVAFAPRLRQGECFGGITAAELWGIPLPSQWGRPTENRAHFARGPGPGQRPSLPSRSIADEHTERRRAIEQQTAVLHVAAQPQIRARRAAGIRGFQFSRPGGSVVLRQGIPVADAISTWLQLANILVLDDLVAAGDFLVRIPEIMARDDPRPFTTVDQLTTATNVFVGRGKAVARQAVGLVREGSDSRPETHLRLLLQRAGLPEPELNPVIRDRFGTRIGRADLVYPNAKLIVEYDGDQHRTDTRQYEHDMTRVYRFGAEGMHVYRVRAHGLYREPELTAARVRGLYLSRASRTSSP